MNRSITNNRLSDRKGTACQRQI